MNKKQLDLILCTRFPRLAPQTAAACKAVILDGATAYAAEKAHNCPTSTVSRHVNNIYREFTYCQEVAAHADQ